MAMITIAAVTFAAASVSGSLDRLDAIRQAGPSASLKAVDVFIIVTLYFAAFFVAIYFNTALIGAAMNRIRSGVPGVWDGFAVANARLRQIVGWTSITATPGLFLRLFHSRSTWPGIAVAIVGGIWEYMTFIVVSVLIVDNVGPFVAVKRSGSRFKSTWGDPVISNIGFGLFRPAALLAAAAPALIVGLLADPVAGITLGFATVCSTVLTLIALESVPGPPCISTPPEASWPKSFPRIFSATISPSEGTTSLQERR